MTSGTMSGVRVVEVATFGFVPSAAAILADWGAEVIKIEDAEHGDPMRGLAAWGVRPGDGGFTYLWEMCNRGKRSVGLKLSTPTGQDIVRRLVADADVFMTNLLPAARSALHLEPADIVAVNPSIIYARGSGLGPEGPEADQRSFDAAAYWARSGIAAATTPAGSEVGLDMPAPAYGDVQAGANLAGGIAAALFHRERTGQAVVVDVSLLSTGMWALQANIVGSKLLGIDQLNKPPHAEAPNPAVNTYATSDGRFISLVMLDSQPYWDALCRSIGRPDLAEDERFQTPRDRARHRGACIAELEATFRQRPLADWEGVLTHQQGPWAVVQRPCDVAADPQVLANGYLTTVTYDEERALDLVAAPVQFDQTSPELRPAPDHGEYTDEALLSLGASWDEILEWKQTGDVC